jgi:hypothetical protein
MIDILYEKMMIPESCYLGKRVFKKLFHENAKLNVTDRKALRDDVDTIIWQYSFKPTTIPIQSYEDDQQEYHEVALLQVNLKQTGRVNRLAEIIHRAIPYPLIVVFVSDTICLISLADKRFSQVEKEAIVAEGFQTTGWLDLLKPTESQGAFLESLEISRWPHTNFFVFYRAAMDRVIALKCAEQSGRYSLELPNGLTVDDRVCKLKQVEKLKQEKSGILNQIKNEKNLGTQVQMNTQIKNITDLIEEISSEL